MTYVQTVINGFAALVQSRWDARAGGGSISACPSTRSRSGSDANGCVTRVAVAVRINVRELAGHVERVANEYQGLDRIHDCRILGKLGQHGQSENGALRIPEEAVSLIWAVLDTLTEGFGLPHGPGGNVLSRCGRIWY